VEPDHPRATAPSFRRILALIGTRRFLDAVADILTLAALAVAVLGHLAPWIQMQGHVPVPEVPLAGLSADSNAAPASGPYSQRPVPGDLQMWHAMRSAAALGAAALLVGISLTLHLGVRARKIFVLLIFACVLAAIVFQVLIFSPYPITEAHRWLATYPVDRHEGFLFALIPSLIAAGLCLVRMMWTMTASPHKNERHLR
jgi:hypothetical protein